VQLRRAAELAGEAAEPALAAQVESSRAILAAFMGDLEGALAAFQAARDVIREQGSADHDITLAINIGIMYGNLGDVDRKIARLRDPWLFASAGSGLGFTLTRQGRFAEAEELLVRCVASAEKAGDGMVLANAHLLLGEARLGAGSLVEAETSLRTAIAMYAGMQSSHNVGRAWTAHARLARTKGDLEEAAASAEKAIAAFASVRARVALSEGRAHFFASTREAYDVAVEVLLERERREPGRGHLARAFALTERARGRSLSEDMSARDGGRPGVPPELARNRQRALDRIGHLQRQLIGQHTSAKPDREAITRLERDIEAAVADEEEARRAIVRASPREAARLLPEWLPAADVQARLAPNEALLEYHVAADASWLFVLTRDRLGVATLPGESALRKDVEALRRHLARPTVLGAGDYAATAFRLYSTLIVPSLPDLAGVDRLRIVPDGPLWEIPFETLVTDASRSVRYEALPYLLRRWAVTYQPTASIVALRHEPQAKGDGDRLDLVAFAAPTVPGAQLRGNAAAGLERAIFREGERWSLPPLPCAEKEARAAARLLGARSEVYIGDQARESRLKESESLRSARYLLFATHAVLSDILPSQSALLLAQVGDGVEDGLLQAHEIAGLDVSAEVVVLSACESAMGRNLRGEGLLGLSRAFFQAGARELVASLWKVADCSTAELVTAFFSRLRRAETEGSGAHALRAAKLRLASRGPTAHPYYWGPFVLLSTRDRGAGSSAELQHRPDRREGPRRPLPSSRYLQSGAPVPR
jgi:CHAT domain-containing protein